MAHLEQLFVSGIRFDTDVQYLAQGPQGMRYENLPVRKSASALISTLTSVIQCVAILGQAPHRRLLGRARRAAQSRLSILDEGEIVRCVEAFGTAVAAQLHPSQGVDEIGKEVRDALRSGHACMLRFESKRASRWATVIGVELDRMADSPRTLLLLDASAVNHGPVGTTCASSCRAWREAPCMPARGSRSVAGISPVRHVPFGFGACSS